MTYALSLVKSLEIDDGRHTSGEKLLIFRVCLNDFMQLKEVLVCLFYLEGEFLVLDKMYSFFKKVHSEFILVAASSFVKYKFPR